MHYNKSFYTTSLYQSATLEFIPSNLYKSQFSSITMLDLYIILDTVLYRLYSNKKKKENRYNKVLTEIFVGFIFFQDKM